MASNGKTSPSMKYRKPISCHEQLTSRHAFLGCRDGTVEFDWSPEEGFWDTGFTMFPWIKHLNVC